MKLLNYTTGYFAGILLFIIAIWAGIFYFSMLNEIHDSIDDGLDNQKGLIIQKAATDSTLLTKSGFDEKDYAITEISSQHAIQMKDEYIDTSMYMQNEDDFEPVRLLKTVFSQNGRYYRLYVATSMVEEDDLTKQLLVSIILLYLGLVIVVLVMNNFLLKRIWRPFYQLLGQLKKFRIDRPTPLSMDKTRVDEFKLLNETATRMLKTNTETYASQKQFIENASHELQTPLAISINKLEALAEHKDLSGEQLELLSSAMDSLERLTRLNKSLLLLSQIENKQFHEMEAVRIDLLVMKVLEDFSDQLQFRDINAELDIRAVCTQQMNSDLALVLVTNLLKNAIVHNKQGGMIRIIVSARLLEIQNSGSSTALDPEKIFMRFYKDARESSTGLGLAIVKSIAGLYGFNISYSFNEFHIIRIEFI